MKTFMLELERSPAPELRASHFAAEAQGSTGSLGPSQAIVGGATREQLLEEGFVLWTHFINGRAFL
jgi:hypothetical protein